MATYTNHYDLEKQAGAEVVNVDIMNTNYDKIDSALFQNVTSVLVANLPLSGWNAKQQTVTVNGLETTGYVYLTMPEASNFSVYAKAGIYPSDVTITNQITFNCTNVPTDNLLVDILKIKVGV
mgnify:FL=1